MTPALSRVIAQHRPDLTALETLYRYQHQNREAEGGGKGNITSDVQTNHSSLFALVFMPTLRVGLDGYASSALSFFRRV